MMKTQNFRAKCSERLTSFVTRLKLKSYHTIDIDIPEDKPKEKTETKENKEASQIRSISFRIQKKPPRKVVAKSSRVSSR